MQVTVGENYTDLFTINATDRNGDSLTFTLSDGPAELTVDSASGVMSWIGVVYSSNQSVVVEVSDGVASSLFTPQVAICNCKNGGRYISYLAYSYSSSLKISHVGCLIFI